MNVVNIFYYIKINSNCVCFVTELLYVSLTVWCSLIEKGLSGSEAICLFLLFWVFLASQ